MELSISYPPKTAAIPSSVASGIFFLIASAKALARFPFSPDVSMLLTTDVACVYSTRWK